MKVSFRVPETELEFEVNLNSECEPPAEGEHFEVRGHVLKVMSVRRALIQMVGLQTHFHHKYVCNCEKVRA